MLGEVLENIGIGIVSVVNTLNPSLVVIGGSLSLLGQPLLDHLSQTLRQRTFPAFQAFLDVRITEQDAAHASAHGAAATVLDDFFGRLGRQGRRRIS